jgi:hypothetical protein
MTDRKRKSGILLKIEGKGVVKKSVRKVKVLRTMRCRESRQHPGILRKG